MHGDRISTKSWQQAHPIRHRTEHPSVSQNTRSGAEESYPNLFKLKVPQFIDSERLECSMEERDGVEPLQNRRHRLPVDEQARKEEAIK